MATKDVATTIEQLDGLIRDIRGQRVMLSEDLARIYGVETRVLNQAVKRNIEKFPADFMFQLTRQEAERLRHSRSQVVILKRGHNIKYQPYAFTEHGAIMAANVLNSPRAVQMSVLVVRAFVRMRQVLAAHKELAAKLAELERKLGTHDEQIEAIFEAIRQLMNQPAPGRRNGFRDEIRRNRQTERASQMNRALQFVQQPRRAVCAAGWGEWNEENTLMNHARQLMPQDDFPSRNAYFSANVIERRAGV
jgi:phage regulator Rha-like protein